MLEIWEEPVLMRFKLEEMCDEPAKGNSLVSRYLVEEEELHWKWQHMGFKFAVW